MNAMTPSQTASLSLGDGAQPPKMTRKVANAVSILASTGQTVAAAAKEAGMNPDALSRAIHRPGMQEHIEYLKALYALDADKLKGMARGAAIRAGIDLMHTAKSEAVRARMVELFAGERGPAVAVQVNVPAPTGYSYDRPPDAASSAAPAQPTVIDGQSTPVDE
ncbi:MAG: hypothetical protein DI533_00360 [Cereibacter sphaeroides]|uniref:Uncharacterized protein n=1 Tax=Cereibacter sphaeroides TaxID=1063 RepID=A0A2W5SIR2_CERSP|nr:MAG: hypothetical protein DI533_00360 [Cereibacter sphaeroides]